MHEQGSKPATPQEMTAKARRSALGAFLRARRARLPPEQLGLAGSARRRTPGLRREEVAERGGISTTWYTWMEQGREVAASAAALDRLAGALLLTPAERAYLFDLAGRRDPAAPPKPLDSTTGTELCGLVETIAQPAYLLDPLWNACAWNGAAARLFVGWLDGAGDPNLLRYIFLAPEAKRLIRDWETRARRVLAEFRADRGRGRDEDAALGLIQDLKAGSPFFVQAWAEQQVMAREGGRRNFTHPEDGPLTFTQITLIPAGQPGMKLVVLAPLRDDGGPDTDDQA